MTPDQFFQTTQSLGLNKTETAALFGYSREQVSRWCAGTYGIPRPVIILIGLLQAGKIAISDITIPPRIRR